MSQGNRHPIGEMNGGWAFLLKLALMLVVPGIGSQVWLAKTVWVLNERVTTSVEIRKQIQEEVRELRTEILTQLTDLHLKLEAHENGTSHKP